MDTRLRSTHETFCVSSFDDVMFEELLFEELRDGEVQDTGNFWGSNAIRRLHSFLTNLSSASLPPETVPHGRVNFTSIALFELWERTGQQPECWFQVLEKN